MRPNYQRSTEQVNSFPRGESQFIPRVRHPFLAASREQFRRPGAEGRKWKARCELIREVCRGFAKLGPDATARMLSRFLRIPLRTVERGVAFALAAGFVENVYQHTDHRRRAHGHFDGDRTIRALHPERLLPQCGGPVPRECGGYKAKNNSRAFDSGAVGAGGGLGGISVESDSSRDTAAAKPAAAVNVSTQTFTPEPNGPVTLDEIEQMLPELYQGCFLQVGMAGWINARVRARKANRRPILDPHRYVRSAIRNFFAQHTMKVAITILRRYAKRDRTLTLEERKALLRKKEVCDLKDVLADNEKLLAKWVRDDDGSDQHAYWIRKLRRRCGYLRGKIRKIQKEETMNKIR